MAKTEEVKIKLVPQEVEYLFEDFGRESLVRRAVIQLVENHREEYEELAGAVVQNEIDELKRRVADQSRKIEKLQELNPQGVNVPMLTRTANELQKRVEELEDGKPKKKRRRIRFDDA